MSKCRNKITSLLISVVKILAKIALSVEGWSHCLTIVSLCSNIIVDIPSIVPLYKNEKNNYGSRHATHALTIPTASDITPFSKVYESKRAFQFLPPNPPKGKEGKKIRGTPHQIFAYELALEYFFTILWPKHSASRRKRRYLFTGLRDRLKSIAVN